MNGNELLRGSENENTQFRVGLFTCHESIVILAYLTSCAFKKLFMDNEYTKNRLRADWLRADWLGAD